MDWIKNNRFLAGYVGTLVAGVILLGGFLLMSANGYKASKAEFEDTDRKVTGLESKKIFPNSKNLADHTKEVADYKTAVDALQSTAASHQQPLRNNFSEQQFRALVADEAATIGAVAEAKELALPDEFKNGMEIYGGGAPINGEAVPLLRWQLLAIKRLVGHAADSGLDSIDELTRDKFPMENKDWKAEAEEAEKAAAEAAKPSRTSRRRPTSSRRKKQEVVVKDVNPMATAGSVMETYRTAVKVTGSYEALQSFLNRLAADDSYFTWVRQVRIENSKKTSPTNADVPNPVVVPGFDRDPDQPEIVPPMLDASVLFGNEKMRAKLFIDHVRFKLPEGAEAVTPVAPESEASAPVTAPVPAEAPAPAEEPAEPTEPAPASAEESATGEEPAPAEPAPTGDSTPPTE